MPPKPQWYHRVSRILEELEALEAPVLDRACIEKLFHVGRWQANALMKRFGGFPSGNTFLLERAELIQKLEAIRDGEPFQRDARRRQRLVHAFRETEPYLPARAVTFQVPRRDSRQVEALGDGITLEPGRLVVEFEKPEELLAKLYELVRTVAEDWQRFQHRVRRP